MSPSSGVPFKATATCAVMARAMGIIIMTAAVFDTHIDRKAVASMKPSRMRCVLVPTKAMMARAMRRCRFHFSMAEAMKKPPRNRKMMSSP